MGRPLRVAIVGAGIGGLAAAGALLRAGAEVQVLEQASALGEVGAGIQMTPNAVKVLRGLGLEGQLARYGFLPQAIVGRDWKSGRVNFRTPLAGECARLYGADYYHIHRADLHRMLRTLVPDERIRLASRCTGVRDEADGVVLDIEGGESVQADVVVGADGIHSKVRESLFGEQPARFTGNMCWRTVVHFPERRHDIVSPDSTMWLGPRGHVVTYYVYAGRAVNVVAVHEAGAWLAESWNTPSTLEELVAAYTGWHPNVLALFERAEAVYKWGLFDRDPLPTWSRGRVTLLGDAAHPMLPFMSQGAAMAMEDAVVLARGLAGCREGDVAAALRAYEETRKPRTSRVQLESRARGETYHLRTRYARIRRDLQYLWRAIRNPQTTGIGANWVYEHDATA